MKQETYRFTLAPQDSTFDERRIKELLDKATSEAIQQALKDGSEIDAKATLEGGFGGIGEITAVLIFLAKSGATAKAVATIEAGAVLAAKGVLGGVSGAAGKAFFDKYLRPRLIRENLLPSDLQPAPSSPNTTAQTPTVETKKDSSERG